MTCLAAAMCSMAATSSATDFPRQAVKPPVSPRAKPWPALPAGEVRRACGAAHLRQCLMPLWCQDMNTGVLQLVSVISVLAIIPALPLAIVYIPMAYWLTSLFCRFFFPLCLPVGDFPDGNRRCRKRSRQAVSALPGFHRAVATSRLQHPPTDAPLSPARR